MIAYTVGFVHAKTGERRNIFVRLLPNEIWDCERHLILRGPNGPGGPDGPIARGYALKHANEKAPRGFVAQLDAIARVRVILGNPDARRWEGLPA